MSVKITRLDGDQFKAEADGYTVLSGRLNEQTPPIGMSPGKLMVASLGLCSAFHAAWFLKRHKIEATSLRIEVDATNDKEQVGHPYSESLSRSVQTSTQSRWRGSSPR